MTAPRGTMNSKIKEEIIDKIWDKIGDVIYEDELYDTWFDEYDFAMYFKFNLGVALARDMNEVEHSNTYGLRTIADELRKLVDDIDAALAKTEDNKAREFVA